jgi:Putative zinc-finger
VNVRDVTELTCKEVVELVTEYLSRALDARDRVRLEQHLLVCPPCTLHLDQVRSTIALARELRDESPPDTEPALVDLFQNWKRRERGELE